MKSILVAEDDKFLANAYRVKLEKESFNVKIAFDGQEVLKYLEAELPDLIVLDLVMPVMDGFTTLSEIKKNPKYQSVPIIIASNLSQKEDIDRGMSLGANDYIIKSEMSLDSLVTKINKLISR